jgi:hypothetical protein
MSVKSAVGASRLWQQEEEGSPMAHSAFHTDRAAMIEDDVFHDCQTQTGASAFARPCFIHAIKALKDPRQMF